MRSYGKIEKIINTHPCFCKTENHAIRMHLPVAKKCDIHCTYCIKKYDCPNESRPGVTARLMSPFEAKERFQKAKEQYGNHLAVVAVAGPGDALSDWENTYETFRLIREIDKNIILCLSTNGLYLPSYWKELVDLKISTITVTVNFLDPSIGQKVCESVVYESRKYSGEAAAMLLSDRQWDGINRIVNAGIVCKINTVYIKGVNDSELVQIAKKGKEYNCFVQNIIPLISLSGTPFSDINVPNCDDMISVRRICGEYLNQMKHCMRCRADAVGTLKN